MEEYINKEGDFIYIYLLKFDDENKIYQLPIPPDEMITNLKTNNKIYETIGIGEISVLKDIGLREIRMSIYLPNDTTLPFIQSKYSPNCIIDKPIIYLNKFREFKIKKKPVRLMIIRILPNGEEIFKTNILLSLENHTVFERAGEEGDFFVELIFKEYRKSEIKKFVPNNNGTYTVSTSRPEKEPSKTYKVQKGDTLWSIAKRELNNENLYKEIMKLNNITDPRKLQIGTILRLS